MGSRSSRVFDRLRGDSGDRPEGNRNQGRPRNREAMETGYRIEATIE